VLVLFFATGLALLARVKPSAGNAARP